MERMGEPAVVNTMGNIMSGQQDSCRYDLTAVAAACSKLVEAQLKPNCCKETGIANKILLQAVQIVADVN